jgi:hypothetical protein
MQTSEQINEIAAAGAKAQAELRPALKDATNPHFSSKYADLAAVMEASRVYARHGIAIWQDVQVTAEGVAVLTRLTHASGQWLEFGPFAVPVSKRDAHGVGSAATYAKRYALCAALGIAADEDDDGNAAARGTAHQTVAVDPPVAPGGFAAFAEFLLDSATGGTASLKAAWKSGTNSQRSHFDLVYPGSLDKLKQQAAAVKGAAA